MEIKADILGTIAKIKFYDVVFIIDLEEFAIFYNGNRMCLTRTIRRYNPHLQERENRESRKKFTLVERYINNKVLLVDYTVSNDGKERRIYLRQWNSIASYRQIQSMANIMLMFQKIDSHEEVCYYENSYITPVKSISVR